MENRIAARYTVEQIFDHDLCVHRACRDWSEAANHLENLPMQRVEQDVWDTAFREEREAAAFLDRVVAQYRRRAGESWWSKVLLWDGDDHIGLETRLRGWYIRHKGLGANGRNGHGR